MMDTIYVIGLEEGYERSVTRIVQLFFDEAKVSFHKMLAEASMPLAIKLQINDREVNVELIIEGKQFGRINSSFEIDDSSIVGNTKKKAVSYCILKLLEEYTGEVQPWGVLTGIRPTKLYHRLRREGKTEEEIRFILRDHYLLTEEKIILLENIVALQLQVLPQFDELRHEVSIYIGIPFCPTKCAYCTFPAYAIKGQGELVSDYLESLHVEMEQVGAWLSENKLKITSIYFGGGTPTSISAKEMDELYEKMYKFFPHVNEVKEITVEAGRPDTIDEEKIEVMKKWQVDRISVNPQSFKNETLQAIGRHHSVEETIEKYKLAYYKGLENINMDLIIGLPGEGIPDFSNSLKEVEKLNPSSVTVHTLSYKRASQMTKDKEKYKVADRDDIHEMMKQTELWAEEQGYQPYYLYRQKNILGNLENVGYAVQGDESIYNIAIMEEAQTIIGLGSGASSKWVDPETRAIERSANPKDPRQYVERHKEVTAQKLDILTNLYK